MTQPMTPKERFLAAIRGQVPDRVPVAPDISNYIPCKRTGLPFWEIYFNGRVPLWQAYAEAMSYFGGEWWIGSCTNPPLLWGDYHAEHIVKDEYHKDQDAMVRRQVIRTPDGELSCEETCYRGEPPTPNVKPIKVLEQDWPRYRWLIPQPTGIDLKPWNQMRQACDAKQQAFGVCVSYPGFQNWQYAIQDGVEALSYALLDTPQILDEWHELSLAQGTKVMQLVLEQKPDYVLFGGSGTITLASPSLAQQYALPALKLWSRMAKDAGVATMLHSCGKSRILIDLLAEQTDVQLINPLEHPPMGDVVLAEAKRARGRQIALMGNLHTTEVMLRGTPALVRQRALEAMSNAGAGGGFVLSTGDQCGRDTPEENLFALIATAKEYGRYDANGRLPAVREAQREAVPAGR